MPRRILPKGLNHTNGAKVQTPEMKRLIEVLKGRIKQKQTNEGRRTDLRNNFLKRTNPSAALQQAHTVNNLSQRKAGVSKSEVRNKIILPDRSKSPITPQLFKMAFLEGYVPTEIARMYGISTKFSRSIFDEICKKETKFMNFINSHDEARLALKGQKGRDPEVEAQFAEIIQKQHEAAEEAKQFLSHKFAKPTPKGIKWAEQKGAELSRRIAKLRGDGKSASQVKIAKDLNDYTIQGLEDEKRELQLYLHGFLPEYRVPKVFADYLKK